MKFASEFVQSKMQPSDAIYNWISIASGNGFVLSGNKPLPKLITTYHQ